MKISFFKFLIYRQNANSNLFSDTCRADNVLFQGTQQSSKRKEQQRMPVNQQWFPSHVVACASNGGARTM